MKKILLIAAVALCAMGCCKKADKKCCGEGCCKDSVECCQKAAEEAVVVEEAPAEEVPAEPAAEAEAHAEVAE